MARHPLPARWSHSDADSTSDTKLSLAVTTMIPTASDGDDPFACFDSDRDESDTQVEAKIRDPDCGVLAFHAGTEQALLLHVQNQLNLPEEQSPESVLQTIDDFCIERHWMMHCGPEKATILKEYCRQCVASRSPASKQFVLVELGTYCGYSSIMLSQALQEMSDLSSFHVYTVEVNPAHVAVAEAMIRLAKLVKNITVVYLDLNGIMKDENQLSNLLRSKLGEATIDFLFLDHAKDAYLSDLQQLEKSGLVASGTYVAADNVVFAQIDEYRTYVKLLASQGIVETQLVESRLEYSEPDANESNKAKLIDGIGKCV